MGDENAILAYYQAIKDGSEEVGQWIRKLYEVILDGLDSNRWFYDPRKAWNAIRFMQRYCLQTQVINGLHSQAAHPWYALWTIAEM